MLKGELTVILASGSITAGLMFIFGIVVVIVSFRRGWNYYDAMTLILTAITDAA